MQGAKIYNNVMVDTGINVPSNGMITVKIANDVKIYNNTIIGAGPSVNNRAIYLNDGPSSGTSPQNIDIKNNIISGVKFAVGFQPGSTLTADYNDYYNNDATPFSSTGGGNINFATWQSQGRDAHGTTANPQLDVNLNVDYKLTSSSPASIKTGGTNLSSIFTIDKSTATRPQTGGWSIGAYDANIKRPTSPITTLK